MHRVAWSNTNVLACELCGVVLLKNYPTFCQRYSIMYFSDCGNICMLLVYLKLTLLLLLVI